MGAQTDSTTTKTAVYVIVVVVAVLIGTVLAPVVWSVTQSSPDDDGPSVAVLTLRGGTDSATVTQVTEDLREARTNESIEAVVLRIDSPGGPVASSEEFYLAVNRTAAEMPVVAYVEGAAASGGYYGIAPSDAIVVKPSSQVGSVGVIVMAPLNLIEQQEKIQGTLLRTGPDKAMITKDTLRTEMETLHNAFLDTVMRHRGDELTLERSEVASGAAYLGPVAVQNGFADEIGDIGVAIERAAQRADGIDDDQYGVVYKEPARPPVPQVEFADADVEKVDGNVVYVDASDDESVEFEKPVKYYAVWGVPVSDDSQEVSTNGSR